ncbi:hypothetical protein CR513_20439, partial [Mucuna pruriens]
MVRLRLPIEPYPNYLGTLYSNLKTNSFKEEDRIPLYPNKASHEEHEEHIKAIMGILMEE